MSTEITGWVCGVLGTLAGMFFTAVAVDGCAEPTVEVGPVEQCPPCPDAGPTDSIYTCAKVYEYWAAYADEKHAEIVEEKKAKHRWRELAEQCAAEKLEVKR